MNVKEVSGSSTQGVMGKLAEITAKKKRAELIKKNEVSKEVESLKILEMKMTNLKTSIGKMDEPNDFLSRSLSWTNTSSPVVTGSAESGTLLGKLSIEVIGLATESRREGSLNISARLSGSSDVSGLTLSTIPVSSALTNGFFTINGSQIELYKEGSTPTSSHAICLTDNLQNLLSMIGTATGGGVTASYDSTQDKINLSSTSTINVGTASDTSNFLSVMKLVGNGTGLVSSSMGLGSVKTASSIGNSNLGTGVVNGNFSINGTSFNYDINADSLESIINSVNSSKAGVNIIYDSTQNRFIIENKITGSLDISISDNTGNLLTAMGLASSSLTLGTNAQFKINNGTTLTSASNTWDGAAHGITGLSITGKQVGSDTITVAQDTSTTKTLIDDFIAKFNDIQSYIKINTTISKETKGPLSKNREIIGIKQDLRSFVFNAVGSLSGGRIKRLADIGIDFKANTNELTIADPVALSTAIQENSQVVATLFGAPQTDPSIRGGFAVELYSFLDNNLKKGNTVFETKITGLQKTISDYDTKIKKLQTELEKSLKEIEIAQAKIERAQHEMNRQLEYLRSNFHHL